MTHPAKRQFTFKQSIKWIGLVIFVGNFLIVIGWLADVSSLKSLCLGQSAIPGNCALGWALAGASSFSLGYQLKWLRRIGLFLALMLVAFGITTVYGGVGNQTCDWLVIQANEQAIPLGLPGQLLFQESVPLIMIGCALLIIDASNRLLRITRNVLISLAVLPATQALVGYAIGNSDLFTFCTATECARLHVFVALVNVVLCLVLLFSSRGRSLQQ